MLENRGIFQTLSLSDKGEVCREYCISVLSMWLEEWCEIVSLQHGPLSCWQCRRVFFPLFLELLVMTEERHCWTMMILLWMVSLRVMVFEEEQGKGKSQLHLNCKSTTTAFDEVKRPLVYGHSRPHSNQNVSLEFNKMLFHVIFPFRDDFSMSQSFALLTFPWAKCWLVHELLFCLLTLCSDSREARRKLP